MTWLSHTGGDGEGRPRALCHLVDVPLVTSFPATCLFLRPRKEQFHQPYCIMLLVMLAPASLLHHPIDCLYRKFDSIAISQYGAAVALFCHFSHSNTVMFYVRFLTVRLFSCPWSCLAASYDNDAAPMLVQPAVVVATTTQVLIGSPVVYTGL